MALQFCQLDALPVSTLIRLKEPGRLSPEVA